MTEIVRDPQLRVVVSGEIDFSNAGEMRRAVEQALAECPQGFVIDLSGVTYLDSSGIQVILYAYKHVISDGGELTLVVTDRHVYDILHLIHLDEFPGMSVHYDLQAAA